MAPFVSTNGVATSFPVVRFSDVASVSGTKVSQSSATVVRPFDDYSPYQLGDCLAGDQTKGIDRTIDFDGVANKLSSSYIDTYAVGGNREITKLNSLRALSTSPGTSVDNFQDVGDSPVLASTLRGLSTTYLFDTFDLTAQCHSPLRGPGITLQLSRRRDASSGSLASDISRYKTRQVPIKVCAAGVELAIRSAGIVPNPELSDGARETFTISTGDFTATSQQSTTTANSAQGRRATFGLARSTTPPCTQATPPAGSLAIAGSLPPAGPGTVTLAPGQPGIPVIYFDPSTGGGVLVQRRVDSSTTEVIRQCLVGTLADRTVDLAGVKTGIRRASMESVSISGDLETIVLSTTDPITVATGQTVPGELVAPTPGVVAGSAQLAPALSATNDPVPFDGLTLDAQCVGPARGGRKASIALSIARGNDAITSLLDARVAQRSGPITGSLTAGPLTIQTFGTMISAQTNTDPTHKSYGLSPSRYTFTSGTQTVQFDANTQRVS